MLPAAPIDTVVPNSPAIELRKDEPRCDARRRASGRPSHEQEQGAQEYAAARPGQTGEQPEDTA